MRILVTGPTGFVGRHVLDALAKREVEIVAVSRGEPTTRYSAVRWLRADLSEPADRVRVVREAQATHLVHLAWRPVHGDLASSRENVDWLTHSVDLVRLFVDGGGKRIVGCGSCFEYDWSYGVCKEDATPLQPVTLYGVAKHALHVATSGLARQAGVSFAWARLFFLYGPDEHPSRLVASVIVALLDGKPAETSHGRQIRDYMHADDAGEGLAALALSEAQGALNIATGTAVSLKDLIGEIASQLGRPDLVRLGARAAQPHEPPIIVGDPTKARQTFGFESRIDLPAGISRTIAGIRVARGGG
jgi:nucleoside-diphosphate-sugar epimerase